jgi:hypothetical protein
VSSEAAAPAQPADTYDFAAESRGHWAYGGYGGLAVADDVGHPMWTDTRDLGGHKQEIFAARIADDAFRR